MMSGSTLYKPNDRVRLLGSSKVGIIVDVVADDHYQVFISETEQPIVSARDIEIVESEYKFVDSQAFLKEILLFKLRKPLTDTL